MGVLSEAVAGGNRQAAENAAGADACALELCAVHSDCGEVAWQLGTALLDERSVQNLYGPNAVKKSPLDVAIRKSLH